MEKKLFRAYSSRRLQPPDFPPAKIEAIFAGAREGADKRKGSAHVFVFCTFRNEISWTKGQKHSSDATVHSLLL